MTTTLTTRSSFLDFRAAMNRREAFTTYGALRGVPLPLSRSRKVISVGRLPKEYHDSVRRADYVIFSYATPIAWHIPSNQREAEMYGSTYGFWVVPDESYSVTTSRHQHKIRAALLEE